ncbi:MAG: DNA-3-methyladenine glycosylase 2 family protein, partial [Streptomyces sp.]
PEEFAVRALVGRSGASLLVERYGKALDAPCGSLTHVFPEPGTLAGEPGPVGELAAALADGRVRLDAGADREDAEAGLLGLAGVDAGVVAVVRMRALGDPDVGLPGVDVPEGWRPWRSYGMRHLSPSGV